MKTKVSIVKCKTYNPEEVMAAVRKAFDLLGGIGLFIKKGEKVVVKPNLLTGKIAEYGVNTHIEVMRSVVRLVKECGARPAIGDNPGGSESPRDVYIASGMATVAKQEGIECLETNEVRIIGGMPISSYFLEYDKIISVPKMKTHSLMVLTGAVKNMYGAVSGLNKSESHKRFPRPEEFVNVLVDVFQKVRPHLVLMDGIIAMDGNGPMSGNLRDVGLLIGGQDGVAIDSVFSRLAGIDPLSILTTREAYKRKLGEADFNKMDILGEDIEKNLIRDFKLPQSKAYMKLPQSLLKVVASFVKFWPHIEKELCRKCMICSKTCPALAITIDKKVSKIDYSKCVRCMCCHEVCPYGAIYLKRNILARLFKI